MNRQELDKMIESYIAWLRSGLSLEHLEAGSELTTPFLDRHNDHIQVYAELTNGGILLSDDGYTLSDLRTSGLDLNTEKREAVLQIILNGFGAKFNNGRIEVESSEKELGRKVHTLIQTILAVNDMFVMAQPRVKSFFWEDVKAFLDQNDVRYSSRIKLTGKSGFDHNLDFLIPHSKKQPERILKVINSPTKSTIGSYIFSLEDISKAREESSKAFAALNDSQKSISSDVIDALRAYNVVPIPWGKRDEYIDELAS